MAFIGRTLITPPRPSQHVAWSQHVPNLCIRNNLVPISCVGNHPWNKKLWHFAFNSNLPPTSLSCSLFLTCIITLLLLLLSYLEKNIHGSFYTNWIITPSDPLSRIPAMFFLSFFHVQNEGGSIIHSKSNSNIEDPEITQLLSLFVT